MDEDIEKALEEFTKTKAGPIGEIVKNLLTVMLGRPTEFILLAYTSPTSSPIVLGDLPVPETHRRLERLMPILSKIVERLVEEKKEEKPH